MICPLPADGRKLFRPTDGSLPVPRSLQLEVEGVFGHSAGHRLLSAEGTASEASNYQLMIDVAARAPD